VVVATTGKLTTLAHAHKYWWRGSYHDGEGRTFFDDRGYDTSVKACVLGVVVPIRQGTEIIGILKCNLEVTDALSNVIVVHARQHGQPMKLVRSGGVVVIEDGAEPLSTRVSDEVVEAMKALELKSFIARGKQDDELLTCGPVGITHESDKYAFGGSRQSIDHTGGNEGEGWHVVSLQPMGQLLSSTEYVTKIIVAVGIVFGSIMALGAWRLSRTLSHPIMELVEHSRRVGQGDFDAKTDITSKDELGVLAGSFNKMTSDLRQTMISRDRLIEEIEQRKQAEEDRERLVHNLGERVKELQCTYGVANSIRKRTDMEGVCRDVCQLIPPSWQYPEITRCRVRLYDVEYVSEGFTETPWRQSRDIDVDGIVRGTVDVCYLQEMPQLDEGPFMTEERELINSIALMLGQAAEHAEAAAERLAYQERLVRLASQQASAEEQQRRLISADLHDRVGQTLVAAKVEIGLLRRSLTSAGDLTAADKSLELIDQTMKDVWSLTFELCPPMLYEAGLEAALEWLAKQFAERHDITCRLICDGNTQLMHDDLRGLLFQASRELLTNVSKHAQATDVEIGVTADDESLRVCVTDNGVGFDRVAAGDKARDAGGFGLFSIRERLRYFGGDLEIHSEPGHGARITMIVPLSSVEEIGEN
jgi:signal transduction histidine kinase/HAMP domain-containing protein